MRISLIAAHGVNREIGRGNDLLWHLPTDMKRFKTLTMGHPVVMGRKTWESFAKFSQTDEPKPLSGRVNIVISRGEYDAPGAEVVHSIDDALDIAMQSHGNEEVFIIGGAEIYALAMNRADRLYITLVYDNEPDADTFFPEYEAQFPKMLMRETYRHKNLLFTFMTLER